MTRFIAPSTQVAHSASRAGPSAFASPRTALGEPRTPFLGLLAAAALLLLPPVAQAGVVYWDTNGTNAGSGNAGGEWGTNLYWNATADGTTTTPGAWLVTTNTANFSAGSDGIGSLGIGVVSTGVTIGGITVDEGTITINSGGGELRLGATTAFTNNSANLFTVNAAVTNAGYTLTVTGSYNTTIGGIIGGAGGLTKSGAGTLQLSGSGANGYSGLTTVNAGTLELNKTGVVAMSGALTIDGSSAIVKLLQGDQIPTGKVVTIQNGGTLNLNGQNQTIGDGLGTNKLIGGAGTNYVTTSAGMLTIGAGATLVGSTVETLNTTGGTLNISGKLSLGSGRQYFNASGASGYLNISADISGSVGTIADGKGWTVLGVNTSTATYDANRFVLSGTNSDFSGQLKIYGTGANNTTLRVTSANALGAGGAGSETILYSTDTTNGVVSLIVNANINSSEIILAQVPYPRIFTTTGGSLGPIVMTSRCGLYAANNTTLTVNGAISEVTAGHVLTVASPSFTAMTGTVVLKGANSYTGATNIGNSTNSLGNKCFLGDGGSISTSSAVTTVGSSTSTFGTRYTTSGNTIAGGNTLTLNSGTFLDLNDSNGNTLAFAGAGTFSGANLKFDLGATTGTSDKVTTVGTAATSAGNKFYFTATGSSLLTGTSAYTLITAGSGLTAANFTLPTTTIAAGGKAYTLALHNSASAETLDVTKTADPTAAYWSGAQDTNWSTIGAANVTNWKNALGGTDPLQTPGSVSDVYFMATSAGNLTTTLGQDFTIKTLNFNSAATSAVTIGGTNTLTITPASPTAGIDVNTASVDHTLSTKVALGAAQTWTVGTGRLLTASNEISGGGGNTLTKAGTGTLTLSGANSYGGGTNVNAGTLKVNNTTGSGTGTGTVTVGSTATLGGNGTIGGNVAINAGGTFAPGNSPGQTTIDNGNLDYASTATYAWEHTAGNDLGITNNTGTATYDQIKLTGTTNGAVTIASGSAINLTFAATTVFSDPFWDSNRDWTIISNTNTAGTLSGTFNIGTIAGYSGGGITGQGAFSTVVSGKDLLLHWAAETAGTAIVVTPASGTVDVDGVAINATSGNYTISGTTVTGAGWTGGGIADGNPTSGDKTEPSHDAANRLNGPNMGTLGFTISGATSGNGSYNYTLSRTVSGNTVAAAGVKRTDTDRTAFGAMQNATILSSRTAALAGLYSETVPKDADLPSVGDRMIVGTKAEVLESSSLAADTTLEMSWRTRLPDETFAGKISPHPMANRAEYLISDVVEVGGVPSDHMYVLQMSYKPGMIDASSGTEETNAAAGLLRLGRLDGSDPNATWVTAGDTSPGKFPTGKLGAYVSGTDHDFVLGNWGVDTTNKVVWAVVKGGGQYAVMIPEPATLGLLLTGLAVLGLAWRRRISKSAAA